MMKWFKSNKDDSQKESKGNKRLTAEQKAAREEAKKLAQKAVEDAKAVKAEKAQAARDKATRSSAENREKIVAEKKKKNSEKNATGKIFKDIISGRFLTNEGVIEHIPFLLFLCAIFLANIGLGYKFENIEREKSKTERRLKEVNAEYKSLMSELESRLQQSRVEQAIQDLGLEQPLSQPILLEEDGDE